MYPAGRARRGTPILEAMRYVVMGVTGCGKTTVGRALAEALGLPFADADDLHPAANIVKMAAGIPLNDDDRAPWLRDVAAWLAAQKHGGVIACSALKRAYRDVIRADAPDAAFVHLAAPQDVLEERVRQRHIADGHFAPVGILDGQYRDLEPLGAAEDGVELDVDALDARAASDAAIAWARAWTAHER